MNTALLLIAHGSREGEANADLLYVAEEIRRQGIYKVVEPAFLELAEPTIRQAAERCAAADVERIIIVPYFLSAGVHVRRDLYNPRNRLADAFPNIRFDLAEPLGRSRKLVDLVVERAQANESSPKPRLES